MFVCNCENMENAIWVNLATAALVLLWMGLLAVGAALLQRRHWLAGGVLVLEGLLGMAAHLALSLVPVGIGEPLIRIGRQDLVAFGAAGFITAVIVAFVAWGKRRFVETFSRRGVRIGLPLLVPVLAASTLAGLSTLSTPTRERERDASRRNVQMAPGFKAEIYASSALNNTAMDNPTTILFAPDGTLYIGDIAGNLWAAKDKNGDHKVEEITQYATGFSLLLGLAWKGDELYVSSSGKIEALRDTDGDGKADARRVLAEGLPSLILNPHSNNSLTFGPDGRLYFGVGATSDDGVEKQPLAASILSVSPDGGDVRVYARGFGNPFEVAFNSKGDMFSGDNGGLSGVDGQAPPDEFNQVQEGRDYGIVPNDPLNQPGKTQALLSFDPHSTPTGLTFYTGKTYPPEYLDNAFIALWNKGDVMRVQLAPDASGSNAAGTYTPNDSFFGRGFLYPIDVVMGPDGNLYIADFGTSVVYRITYEGGQ